MYKVFFNDRQLVLTSPGRIPAGMQAESITLLDRQTLGRMIMEFESTKTGDLCLAHADESSLFSLFSSFYLLLEAAGGVVRHSSGRYLFIKRFGKWDLPKGKIEPGESPGEAALREVTEESGIALPVLSDPLPPTYHTYTLDGTRILKKTCWFAMEYDGTTATMPQREEGITEAVWLVPAQFDVVLGNTYRSIASLLEELTWIGMDSIHPEY